MDVTRRDFLIATAAVPVAVSGVTEQDPMAQDGITATEAKFDPICGCKAGIVNRREFERVTPESVGIASAAIERLLDEIESSSETEPHGLMIMRHGRVCAEGWWAPYSVGLPHLLWSLTKTYTGTAIGIAYTEGLLRLDDLVVKYFPEYTSLDTGPYIKKMTIRDVLCMASGKAKPHRSNTANWCKHYFLTPFSAAPGTKFQYGCEDTHILMAVLKKITGQGLREFLKPTLFDKIGIDANNLKWICLPDGSEVACGGLHATTEDSARLMLPYLRGGVWEGQRILAHDYMTQATTKQIDTSADGKGAGYGYQIWMSSRPGTYYGMGAMGQNAMAVTDLDMVVVYYEAGFWATRAATAALPPVTAPEGRFKVIHDIIHNLLPDVQLAALPEDKGASGRLANRLKRLTLGNAEASVAPPMAAMIRGRPFAVTSGEFTLRTRLWEQTTIDGSYDNKGFGMDWFLFDFERPGVCGFSFKKRGKDYSLEVGLDGVRRLNRFALEKTCIDKVLLDGRWVSDHTFRLNARWIETCFHISVDVAFSGNDAVITLVSANGDYNSHPLRFGKAVTQTFAA